MSSIAARRILKDLKLIENEQSEHYQVIPSEENIFYWKGFILPPSDSLYYGLILPFSIEFPKDYPNIPPKIKFPPKLVFHPNIFEDGSICLDVLQNKWTKLHNVNSILLTLMLLLKEPNPDSPANTKAANIFLENI